MKTINLLSDIKIANLGSNEYFVKNAIIEKLAEKFSIPLENLSDAFYCITIYEGEVKLQGRYNQEIKEFLENTLGSEFTISGGYTSTEFISNGIQVEITLT
jgi:hypothetical protein